MKTTSKAILWIIVVFLTGVLCGGALTFVIYRPDHPPLADRKSREDRLNEFVQLMSTELTLDERQREEFRKLLMDSREIFREAHRKASQETREKLRAVLRPDQLERFDELMAKIPHHPLGRRWKPKQ